MADKEDILLSVGFDLSSIDSSLKTAQRILKNQKLIANIAYQFGTSQGEVRNQFKNFIAGLNADSRNNPVKIQGELDLDTLPRTRYALYDVSNITQQLSTALLNFGSSSVMAAAEFETAFTGVERTTMANLDLLDSLNSQLRGLARDIPVAFADITQIASLGAQLGIATGDLAGFAATVSQFSAVTNVTVESAATSFGALGQLLDVSADKYQNLGSAIAQVGVNSIATESEILSVSTQIGGVAASAGLSAEYVIGLSGALASLRIPAEQSRGALTRVFQEINRAAAEGGPAIQNFANVLGVSTEEATRLAKTDVESFFTQFISGLSRLDNTNLTTTLDALGLSELRVTNTLTRLSRNTDLLAQTQGDASQAFEEGTFLAAAYALRVEDLAAKLTILQNSVTELIATFGESILPVVGPIIDSISDMVQGITDALSTESGQWTSRIALGAVFLSGTLLTVISSTALLVASLFALRTAINGLGWATATTGFKGFAATLFLTNVRASALTATLFGTSGAVAGLSKGVAAASLAMRALPIIAIIGTLAALAVSFQEASNSAEVSFQNLIGDTTGLADALQADTDAYNQLTFAQKQAAGGAIEVQYAGSQISEKYGDAAERVGYTAEVLGKSIPESAYAASSAIEYNTRIIGENTQAWLNNMLMQNESFQNIVGNSDFANFVEKTGYDLAEAFRLQAEVGGDAAAEYYERVATDAVVAGLITIEEVAAIDAILASQIMADNEYLKTLPADGGQVAIFKFVANMLPAINEAISILGPFADFIRDFFKNVLNIDLRNSGKQVSQALKGAVAQTSIMDIASRAATTSTDDFGASLGNLGNAADDAAKKVYLLTDYANDLSSIWDRAFDIRFSGGQTLDKITSSFSKIAKATADAREEIQELNADIQSLEADRALQEYFLSVAEAYGDTLRAQEIRANLAKIDVDLTKKTKDLQKAQDKTNKTLIGSSDAAIENRDEILDLVKGYQDHIKALAASGMKEDELRRTSERLKAEFIAQATQLGYNEVELQQYAVAFDDVRVAIDNVPRNVTVDFNGDAALTAINEFAAKAKAAIASSSGKVQVGAAVDEGAATRAGQRAAFLEQYAYWNTQANPANAPGKAAGYYMRAGQLAASFWGRASALNYYSGGYTGAGGKYEPAGIVHRGEYVVPKEQVNQATKMPYFMEQPRSFAQGGFVGGGGGGAVSMMVELSPYDRKLLAQAGNIQLRLDGKVVAQNTNANNAVAAQRGSN